MVKFMEEIRVINIHGKDIVCYLEPRSFTRLHFFYSYGEIIVSYPPHYNLERLKTDLENAFSKNKIKKFSSEHLIGTDYIYILGVRHRLLRSDYYGEISKEDIVFTNLEAIQKKLKKLAYDIILTRVKHYEQIMKTSAHNIKITDCYTTKGKNYIAKKLLIFDYRLIHFSVEIIDSVVVHELAHDFVANHSADFYRVVEHYLPNYNELHQKLTYGVKQ